MKSRPSKRSHRAAGEMFSLMKTYDEGDQKRGDFCVQYGLKPWVFSYWRKKYLLTKDSKAVPPKFVALMPEQKVGSGMVLCYGGVELRLEPGLGVDFVGDLVLKLAARC